ncbi:hypothetical protein [Clostridium thermarum]|nr:hypothetical protein [Clostridium thermarum]
MDILSFTADFGAAKENIDFCMNVFIHQNFIVIPLGDFLSALSKINV